MFVLFAALCSSDPRAGARIRPTPLRVMGDQILILISETTQTLRL